MLSPIEVKARTYLNFKAMGENWTDEKAKAHADIADSEWPQVEEEIAKLRAKAEERSPQRLEERLKEAEKQLVVLRMLPHEVSTLRERFAELEKRSASLPHSSQPKPRRKQNLSPEERQRRSDQMKAIVAKQRAAREARKPLDNAAKPTD